MPHGLTADHCARAIVASARAFGDDPVKAFTAKRGRSRRAMAPAVRALVVHTGHRVSKICRVLGVSASAYGVASKSEGRTFERAVDAALDALRADYWAARPAAAVIASLLPEADRTALADAPKRAARPKAAPPARIDHSAAIRASLGKLRRPAVQFEVVGVGTDRAALKACSWPIGDPQDADYRSCGRPAVQGRPYCGDHCCAAGMKATPKEVSTVGRTARPYGVRELERED